MKRTVYSLVMFTLLLSLIVTACGSPATTQTTAPPSSTAPLPTSITATSTTTTNSGNTTTTAAPTSTTPKPTQPASTASSKNGGNLIVTTGTLPDGIFGYPVDIVNGASFRVSSHVLEGLIEMNWDGVVTPLLAESWDIPTDKSSITFHLKKGVKFIDGTDFNAAAVKWNFDNEIAAKKITTWKSVDVVDDYTVRVNFTQYQNIILQQFCDSTGWIYSPTAFQKNGQQWADANPVGTAAFILDNFSRDVSASMKKNSNYWQAGKPYLDSLKYIFVTDVMTQYAFMKSGGADVWWTGTAKWAAQAAASGFTNVNYIGTVYGLIPDSANADSPWSNLKVRQAAEYALDREAIAKALGYGLTQAVYQIAPRGSIEYDPNFAGRKYDVAKAKQLLSEAGYPSGFKTSLILQISSNTNNDEVLAIQAYLKAAGIDASVNYYETSQYYQFRNGKWKNGLLLEPLAAYGNYNSTLKSYFAPAPVTTLFQSLNRSEAWLAAYNATVNSTLPDPALMRAAVKEIGDEAMVIPTSEQVTNWAVSPAHNIQDLNLLKRHWALYFNAENAWFGTK
jgi:peptide/nickel transport system substrate-binding protein